MTSLYAIRDVYDVIVRNNEKKHAQFSLRQSNTAIACFEYVPHIATLPGGNFGEMSNLANRD